MPKPLPGFYRCTSPCSPARYCGPSYILLAKMPWPLSTTAQFPPKKKKVQPHKPTIFVTTKLESPSRFYCYYSFASFFFLSLFLPRFRPRGDNEKRILHHRHSNQVVSSALAHASTPSPIPSARGRRPQSPLLAAAAHASSAAGATMKDKMKEFMKKVASSGSGTPSSFKGTSHVLGSGSSSSPSSHPAARSSNPRPAPAPKRPSPPPPPDFTPFTPLVSSSSSRRPDANGTATVACPSCGDAFPSELAVSDHIDGCLASAGGARARAAVYLAADPPPPAASVEVVKRLLGNLLREPGNDKFRRVRLSNPRIKEAVADREGGVELLEAVGFSIGDEGGEPFAVMGEVPSHARLNGIRRAVLLLEAAHPSAPPAKAEAEAKESNVADVQEGAKAIDRQVSRGFRLVIRHLMCL